MKSWIVKQRWQPRTGHKLSCHLRREFLRHCWILSSYNCNLGRFLTGWTISLQRYLFLRIYLIFTFFRWIKYVLILLFECFFTSLVIDSVLFWLLMLNQLAQLLEIHIAGSTEERSMTSVDPQVVFHIILATEGLAGAFWVCAVI